MSDTHKIPQVDAVQGQPSPSVVHEEGGTDRTQASAAFMLFCFLAFVAVSGQAGYWLLLNKSGHFLAEYLSYALPALAAVAGAMTVFGRLPKTIFWFASSFVFLGLLAFIYSKGNIVEVSKMGIFLTGFLATAATIPIINIIERRRKRESPLVSGTVGLYVLAFLIIQGFAFYGVIKSAGVNRTSNTTATKQPRLLSCEQPTASPSTGKLIWVCTEDN